MQVRKTAGPATWSLRSSTSERARPSHPLSLTTTTMLRARALASLRPAFRTYATAANTHALVFLEHKDGAIDAGSLSALTAAEQLGGQVTGLIVGAPEEVQKVVPQAQK